MNKFFRLFLIFIIFFAAQKIQSRHNVSAIFIDIEAIFQTDSMRASSYIGKIDSIRYLSSVGRLPSQEDLFKQLKPIKAKSTQVTYNNNLELPLILSDWLTALQSANKLKETIQKYFNNKNISEIEKKVLFAIVSMMLTPQHLAHTQKVSSKMENLLEKIKRSGIKIYLVGNWAHISALKSEFTHLFSLFSGIYVSGDLHILKPSSKYYQTVLDKSGINADNAIWIETEPKFIAKVKKLGMNVISYNHDNHDHVIRALRQYDIAV